MKQIFTIIFIVFCLQGFSQDMEVSFYPSNVEKYDVRVLTDKNVARKISAQWQKQADLLASETRGAFLDGFFEAAKSAAFGAFGQSASTIASVTISTLADALKSKKDEWKKAVEEENRYEKKITMLENIDDFYSTVSDAGALDPSGMSFNGFSCLQKRGGDTVFFFSCHLDTSEYALARILRHSKFQLKLDTLVFNPSLCNLPNDKSRAYSERKPFSFSERKNLSFSIETEIFSSWINQAVQIHNDVKLGSFFISVPVSESSLEADGVFRFISGKELKSGDCQIVGDCFIVPRSYIGVRDESGIYHDAWGTGQYRVAMTIKETCGITEDFEKHWKDDWKSRPKQSDIKQSLATAVKQTFSKNSSSWISTLTEAPVNYTKQEIIKALSGSASTKSSGQQQKKQDTPKVK